MLTAAIFLSNKAPKRLLIPAGYRHVAAISHGSQRFFSTTEGGTVADSAAVKENKSATEDGKENSEIDKSAAEDKSDLVPGKPYRNINTHVKHLQHMTSEDLAAPDPQMVASTMKDLILEAKDKIRPVVKAMPEEELKEILMTLEEAKQDGQIVIHRAEFYQVIERIGVTLEELRKI